MTDKEYKKRLKSAPPQKSREFLTFLKKKNEVVWESKKFNWLIIVNCKYNTPEIPWLTAFYTKSGMPGPESLGVLFSVYRDWEILKKSPSRQTVPGRFHLHLIRK